MNATARRHPASTTLPEEGLKLTVTSISDENEWIKPRTKKLMLEIIKHCLTEAQVVGTVSVTFLCIRDCLKKKNQHARSMILQRGFRVQGPNSVAVLLIGDNPRNDICYITLVMPLDAKVLLLSFFENARTRDQFRYIVEPKLVTEEMLGQIEEEEKDWPSTGPVELTPIDDTVAILYLVEVRRMGGEITRDTAEALVKTHFPDEDWHLDGDLVETMLEKGYLKKAAEGKIVKLTGEANKLLAADEEKTRRSLLSMEEVPATTSTAAQTTDDIQAQRFIQLKALVKDARARLEEANQKNQAAERALAPLRLQITTARNQMAEHEKNIASHEKLAEKHSRLAREIKQQHTTKREDVLKLEQQIRDQTEQMSTSAASIESELKTLLEEQRKLLED